MISPRSRRLSIEDQCSILGLPRSTYYYKAQEIDAEVEKIAYKGEEYGGNVVVAKALTMGESGYLTGESENEYYIMIGGKVLPIAKDAVEVMSSVPVEEKRFEMMNEAQAEFFGMLSPVEGAAATDAENAAAESAPAVEESDALPALPEDADVSVMDMTQRAPAEGVSNVENTQPVWVMPTENVKGTERAAYHLAPVERTLEDLFDGSLTAEEVDELVDARIAEAQKDVKALEKKAPKMGASKEAYLQAKKEWQENTERQQKKLDYYNALKEHIAKYTHSEMQEALDNAQVENSVPTVHDVVANALNGMKITPESYRKDTGLSTEEQKKLVGLIAGREKGGVSIERAAEIIAENFDEELREAGFHGDVMDVRGMIIDVLQEGGPRGYAARSAQMRNDAERSAMEADMERMTQRAFHMSVDEYIAYEQSFLPRVVEHYRGFDENEYYSNLADENFNNNERYDTERESAAVSNSSEVLQGAQSVPTAGIESTDGGNKGGAVSNDVQGGSENAAVQGEKSVSEQPAAVAEVQEAEENAEALSDNVQEAEENGDVAEDVQEDNFPNNDAILEPRFESETMANGDVVTTGYNSRGEVVSIATERDGRIVEVESYEDGLLFERTAFDENGRAERTVRYNKKGDALFAQEYNDGVAGRRVPLYGERVRMWREKFGVRVRVAASIDEVENADARRAIAEGRNVQGWFETGTGEVWVYAPNTSSVEELDKTVLHEVVAHKGLRGLLGKKFDALCDEVFKALGAKNQKKWLEYVAQKKMSAEAVESASEKLKRAAADEYIAHLAENMDQEERGVVKKVVDAIRYALRRAFGVEMNDADIKTLLARSAEKLQRDAEQASRGARVSETRMRVKAWDNLRKEIAGKGGRYTKKSVEKGFGGIWIKNNEEFAKFASAVNNYGFEESGEGVTYTDNYFYAYYRNIDGEAIPFVRIYLNEEQSQDLVNSIRQDYDGSIRETVKQRTDRIVKGFRSNEGSGNVSNGNNNNTGATARGRRVDSDLFRKGRYLDAPSLYVKGKRADRTEVEDDTRFRETYKSKDGSQVSFTSIRTDDIGSRPDNVQRSGTELTGTRYLGRLSEGEFCLVERVFSETKAFSFSGAETIETVEDVAYIFKELEDASVENSFAVLVKDDKPTVLHLGMGDFYSTSFLLEAIIAADNRINADKIYFVHNHPSGNLTASNADMIAYAKIKRALGSKLQEGIIINLTSGKFATFSDAITGDRSVRRDPKKEVNLTTYSFSKQVFDKDFNFDDLFFIGSSEDVAKFISSHRLGKRDKMSVLVLNKAHRVVANVFLPYSGITPENRDKIGDEISDKVISLGGAAAIVYGRFSWPGISNLALYCKARGVDLLDAVNVLNMQSEADEGRLSEKSEVYENSEENATRFRELTPEEEAIVEEAKKNGTYLKAPNGKKTNLTPKQWAQVRTKAFKEWFGDWENDPENASKVVDENGEPKVVYHGNKQPGFSVFNTRGRFRDKGSTTKDAGVYATDDRQIAYYYTSKQDYGNGGDFRFDNPKGIGQVYSLFLNVRNPLVIDCKGEDFDEIIFNGKKTSTDKVARAARKGVYGANVDGVIFNNVYDVDYTTDYVVFEPNQIKSATDNVGTFDENTGDIRFRFIGERGAESLDKAEEATVRLDNLAVAREMESAKKDAKAIKMATGWERGADGLWRYEVEDFEIDMSGLARKNKLYSKLPWANEYDALSDKLFDGIPLTEEEDERLEELLNRSQELRETYENLDTRYLDDYIVDEDLFTAYPQLKQIEVVIYNSDNGPDASYDEENKRLKINSSSNIESKSIFAHEIQHAIQRIEGFARGGSEMSAMMYLSQHPLLEKKFELEATMKKAQSMGIDVSKAELEVLLSGNHEKAIEVEKAVVARNGVSDEYFADIYDPGTFAAYQHLAGEVEARNAQARMNMTAEERRNSLASETEDVAREDQIFLMENAGETRFRETEEEQDNDVLYRRVEGVATNFTYKNFYETTRAVFNRVERPNREPDYVSHKFMQPDKISSEYWYGEDENGEYVVRGSDHWSGVEPKLPYNDKYARSIGSCFWYIDKFDFEKDTHQERQYLWDSFYGEYRYKTVNVSNVLYGKVYLSDMKDARRIIPTQPNQIKSATDNVGTFDENTGDIRFREGDSIDAVNARFNEELEKYSKGELPTGHRFDLGMPSEYLLSAGFDYLPISMRASLLSHKAGDERHPFDASDIKDLVNALQKPIAVFEYSKPNMRNLIVDVNRNGKHFLVGITLNYQANGIEINSVSGLFPKESHEWIKWIQDGKAIRIDQKDKVQNLINSLRTNPAESERIGLNLNAVANVVENFENPSIEEENLSDRGKTLFREGEKKYTVEPVQYTTKSGKVLDMFLLKFDEQLTEEQMNHAKKVAEDRYGWYDERLGGFMMRTEAGAKNLGDRVASGEKMKKPTSLFDTLNGSVSGLEAVQKLAEVYKGNAAIRDAALKALARELRAARRAAAVQKDYDKKTVQNIVNVAKAMLISNPVLQLQRSEVNALLTTINRSVGTADITKQAQKLLDVITKAHIRHMEVSLEKLLKVKAQKTNDSGVVVQGVLDVEGQRIMAALESGKAMSDEMLDERIAEVNNRIAELDERIAGLNEGDERIAEMSDERNSDEIELLGLELAKRLKDIEAANEDIKTLEKERGETMLTGKEKTEFLKEKNEAIIEQRLMLADEIRELIADLREIQKGSKSKAKEFRERKKERIERVHHASNGDMRGVPVWSRREGETMSEEVLNGLANTVFAPMGTFDQMLRFFGRYSVNGTGRLYRHFMSLYHEAAETEFLRRKQANEELNEKLSEIFGKKMRFSDVYSIEENGKRMDVSFYDEGMERVMSLTQGQLLYIYMVDKMSDGRMKLRNMGITEEMVQEIKENLDERFIKFTDWVQEEFLPKRRKHYNAVHEKLFGASMSEVENYFPLRIQRDAIPVKNADEPMDSERVSGTCSPEWQLSLHFSFLYGFNVLD